MKLRIRGNSIRLRLTKSEVEQIKESGLVEEKTVFPNNQIFTYSISSTDSIDQIQAEFIPNNLKIFLPKSMAEKWVNSFEEGIYGEAENLQISVEKDFNCLKPRDGDEDKDTFPHPKEGSLHG